MTIQMPAVQRVCHYLRSARLRELMPHFLISTVAAEIDTPVRAAMYLAQLAFESNQFRNFHELGNEKYFLARYDVSENPRVAARLGNVQPGDGPKYCGRGAIQITGRSNYRDAGLVLGLPLEEQPDLAALDENAFRVASWFWGANLLNSFADAGDVEGATRRINGGLNGLDQRRLYYEIAIDALAIT